MVCICGWISVSELLSACLYTGIPDVVEGGLDTDGDGLRDFEDSDSDNDGILDRIECAVSNLTAAEGSPPDEATVFVCPDTDNDSIPDYVDTDSDNDGTLCVVRCVSMCVRSYFGRAGGRMVGQTGALAGVCEGGRACGCDASKYAHAHVHVCV